MRRVWAIWLAVFFGLSPILPGLFVDDQSNLPACCRRNGKHHCVMAIEEIMLTMAPDAPQLSGVCDKYAHFHIVQGAPGSLGGALPAAIQSAFVFAPVVRSAAVQPLSRLRIAFSRSRQKRGPPSLSL